MTNPVCPNCKKVDRGARLPSDHGGEFFFTRCGDCNHGYRFNSKGEIASDRELPPSKKCVLEVFLKYDGFPEKWGLRLVREDVSTFEILESAKPIEVRPYGAGAAHEPLSGDALLKHLEGQCQAVWRTSFTIVCTLPKGHDGDHRADCGYTFNGEVDVRATQPPSDEVENLRFALRRIRDTCGNEDPHGGTRAAEIAAHALFPTLTKEPARPTVSRSDVDAFFNPDGDGDPRID